MMIIDIALITGGLGGIGKEIVKSIEDISVKRIVVDKVKPDYQSPNVEYLQVDITNQDDLAMLKNYLKERSYSIKYLIHTAAKAQYKRFELTTSKEWKEILRTNLEGTLAITETLLPFMEDSGRIVFFASGTVFKGTENLAPYVSSKMGVIGFARCLSMELGDRDITVNVVAPGMTDTNMIQDMAETEPANIQSRALKRREYPSDVVGVVRFLLSKDASFITGQTIVVDGGSVKH
jgi:2-hydroxycyclohexanecarboxyl-CoA dehydrogenase